jgi:two-component system KDP operon response regulator KdpE
MAEGTSKVLVVDDDHDIRRLVVTVLERDGMAGVEAGDGQEALRSFFDHRPSAVVLDLGLPGLDGWEVLSRIRQLSDAPVLLLSAETSEGAKVRALGMGADDYVTKPFGQDELVARVRSLIERRGREPADPQRLTAGSLLADLGLRLVEVDGRPVDLSPTEFELLVVLLRNRDQVTTQQQLLEEVWGNGEADVQRVRLYVSYLRRKLAAAGAADAIETVRGLGYRVRATQ